MGFFSSDTLRAIVSRNISSATLMTNKVTVTKAVKMEGESGRIT